MKTSKQAYFKRLQHAGFIEDQQATKMVIDRGEFFHIVVEDSVDEDNIIVSRFYKMTNDFAAMPDFESNDISKCLDFILDWTSDK